MKKFSVLAIFFFAHFSQAYGIEEYKLSARDLTQFFESIRVSPSQVFVFDVDGTLLSSGKGGEESHIPVVQEFLKKILSLPGRERPLIMISSAVGDLRETQRKLANLLGIKRADALFGKSVQLLHPFEERGIKGFTSCCGKLCSALVLTQEEFEIFKRPDHAERLKRKSFVNKGIALWQCIKEDKSRTIRDIYIIDDRADYLNIFKKDVDSLEKMGIFLTLERLITVSF